MSIHMHDLCAWFLHTYKLYVCSCARVHVSVYGKVCRYAHAYVCMYLFMLVYDNNVYCKHYSFSMLLEFCRQLRHYFSRYWVKARMQHVHVVCCAYMHSFMLYVYAYTPSLTHIYTCTYTNSTCIYVHIRTYVNTHVHS